VVPYVNVLVVDKCRQTKCLPICTCMIETCLSEVLGGYHGGSASHGRYQCILLACKMEFLNVIIKCNHYVSKAK